MEKMISVVLLIVGVTSVIACNKGFDGHHHHGYGWADPHHPVVILPKPTLFPKLKQAFVDGKLSVNAYKIIAPSLKPLPYKKGIGWIGKGWLPQGHHGFEHGFGHGHHGFGHGHPGFGHGHPGFGHGHHGFGGHGLNALGGYGVGKSGYVGLTYGKGFGYDKGFGKGLFGKGIGFGKGLGFGKGIGLEYGKQVGILGPVGLGAGIHGPLGHIPHHSAHHLGHHSGHHLGDHGGIGGHHVGHVGHVGPHLGVGHHHPIPHIPHHGPVGQIGHTISENSVTVVDKGLPHGGIPHGPIGNGLYG